MASTSPAWSVYPCWIDRGLEYARVRAEEGTIGIGRRVSVERNGKWLPARVIEPDLGSGSAGGLLGSVSV